MKTTIYFIMIIFLLPLSSNAQIECSVIGTPINHFNLSDLSDQMNKDEALPDFSACTIQGSQISNSALEEISLIIVGNASCPPAREFMLWCKDKGVKVYIWYTLENHPVSGGAVWNGWQPFPASQNVPDWEFAQTVAYGDQIVQIDLLKERFNLNDDFIFLLDDANNLLSKLAGRPFNLFVVYNQQILFESPSSVGIVNDSIPFVNIIDSLNNITVLGINDQSTSIDLIAPNPVTSESRWTGSQQVEIILNDLFGRQVAIVTDGFMMDNISSGYYVATVVDQKTGQIISRQKLIIP